MLRSSDAEAALRQRSGKVRRSKLQAAMVQGGTKAEREAANAEIAQWKVDERPIVRRWEHALLAAPAACLTPCYPLSWRGPLTSGRSCSAGRCRS